MSKEEIEKAKKITKNYIKDTPVAPYECLMNEERKAAIVLLEYIEQLEKELETYKDIKSIANTKITELTQIKDIDKLKSENWILQNKLNKYESREQKLIEKLQEESNIHNENWKGVEIEKYAKEILEMLKKE